MKKYILYLNCGDFLSSSKTHTQSIIDHYISGLKKSGIVRPIDKIFAFPIEKSDTRLEIHKVPFMEAISHYIDYYFGVPVEEKKK